MGRDLGSTERGMDAGLPGRTYGLVIVALTVFFAGLLLWRSPVRGVLVTADVALSAPPGGPPPVSIQGSPEAVAELKAALLSRQNVADAIRYADQSCVRQGAGKQETLADARLKSVAAALELRVKSATADQTRIEISYRGSDPSWSKALVERLSRAFLTSAGESAASRDVLAQRVRVARWQIDEQRHYERKARLELESALDIHDEQVEEDLAGGYSDTIPEAEAGTSSPFNTPNPQWQRIQGELGGLAEQLHTLLDTLTPNHPQVQDILARMEVLRRQLNETPRFGRTALPAGGGTSPNTTGAITAASAQWPVSTGAAAAAVPDPVAYRQARATYDESVGRRESAERNLVELLDGQLDRGVVAGGPERWMLVPPQVTGRLGGRPSGRRVATMGILALLCGAAMAWYLGTLRGLRNVNSVQELAALVSVPVVGQLSIDPWTQGIRRLRRRGRVVRWTIAGCEFALSGLVIVFLVAAIAAGPTWNHLMRDPFGTVADTIMTACRAW